MPRVSARERIFTWGLCAAALLASSRAAAADAVPLNLTWNAAGGECPTRDNLVRQVAELVENHPTSAYAVRAVADVEHIGPERYRVRLTTESQGLRGTRVVEERSCQALANVVVLILAWMIQPDRSRAESGKDAEPSAVLADPPARARPKRLRSQAASMFDQQEWSFSLRAAGDLGSLPTAALGGLAAVSYRTGRLQLTIQGSYFPASRSEVAPVAGFLRTGGDFSLRVLSLVGCFEPTLARVGLCAGPELAHLRGKGFGVSAPATGERAWVSLLFGLRSALHLGRRLWLEAAIEAALPALRQEFALDRVGIVHRPSALAARASFGLGLTL